MLENKRILFICPKFFNYHNLILDELKIKGAMVKYINEAPFNNIFVKYAIRKNSSLFKKKINKYYFKEIDELSQNFDYIFVIKGSTITEDVLKELRKKYSDTKFILYLWDSIRNIKGIERKFSYFDSIYSFDFKDIEKNPRIKYAYLGLSKKILNEKTDKIYDIVFVGTMHSIRPRVLSEIEAFAKMNGLNIFFYKYMSNIFLYIYQKLTNSNFKYIKLKEVSFKKLSYNNILLLYKQSKCVLDIQTPKQTGYTSRLGEIIYLKTKLITNNESIIHDKIFRYGNVYIYSNDKIDLDIGFINKPYKNVHDSITDKFTLSYFINQVIQ